jgi:hypothetical protein
VTAGEAVSEGHDTAAEVLLPAAAMPGGTPGTAACAGTGLRHRAVMASADVIAPVATRDLIFLSTIWPPEPQGEGITVTFGWLDD